MDKDGSHIRRAPSPALGNAFYPSGYPDGQRILETVYEDNTLCSVDTRTGAVVKITTTPALMIGMASVSPDGKWIAAAAQLRQGRPYDQRVNQIWNDREAMVIAAEIWEETSRRDLATDECRKWSAQRAQQIREALAADPG